MERFLNRHNDRIVGSISGFDRMRFTGTLRWMAHVDGMGKFLNSQAVLLKNFGTYIEKVSEEIKQYAYRVAEAKDRPVQYLPSSSDSKEDVAMKIAERDGIRDGLVGVLTCVEPCQSFAIKKDKKQKQLKLVGRWRKCLHVYFYWLDSDYGLMHLRLQTWAPFTIQVCVNGREWLARQMDKVGLNYQRQDNYFAWISDAAKAQRLMDQQPQIQWRPELEKLLNQTHPLHQEICRPLEWEYYWTCCESEYATDVMFKEPARLAGLALDAT